jgi:predicted nucleic acid-binding Zn ribbon protein
MSLPAPRTEACPLCGAPVGNAELRCPDCNMTLDGIGRRPPAFTKQSVWFWAGALLAIYLVVLAIVVLAR